MIGNVGHWQVSALTRAAREQGMNEMPNDRILDVRCLEVRFLTDLGTVNAVNGLSFQVRSGEAIGIVGESGCGKSVAAYSILRILPKSARITKGEICFRRQDGRVEDLTQVDANGKEMRRIRGAEISMIFQEPMTAFSPVHTVGNQICESMLLHQDVTKTSARDRAVKLLGLVGIPNPEQRVDEYPFQLSGGMRQRAMVAMALACNIRLLIADEPTTALDVIIKAQVLKLIKEMQQDRHLSLILITHDLGVIAHLVDRVYVVYLGHLLEVAPVAEIFAGPRHPYTRDLLKSIPRMKGGKERLQAIRGSVPDSLALPTGCPFHPRCQDVVGDICKRAFPAETEVGPGHRVSCFKYTEEGAKAYAGPDR